ncbi:peptidylprolyl isomerase [Phaeodactylibacter sp.]|uniref:peptidylprolyl isomerase n=1 Tax=Phaeodactylibacter sp. TaxID=1940289 RepID=UPI0025CB985D|nr:peptidylprolyl isomerase [Phaeodactylibacter sp.]MCI4648750.1 peptidylprolyl isomerase [Phaeodactylibacter sp.]MCI5091348.1 peptidylprolyl isomerase [Phaeodactylibacter sp.]
MDTAMKYWISALCVLFIGTSGWAQREVIDKVVATVGGELVLLSEVEEQRALMASQQSNLPDDIRCSIMDQIMANKLLLNQSKLDSIMVTDEEVEVQLDARIERILGFMNNDVSQFEEYYGQSINEVKAQFREDLKNQLLVDRMRGNIMASVTVTPSEVKTFFNSIPQDSLPYFNAEVEIGEIVYKPKVNKEERERAVSLLEELRERIVDGGESFAELAGKYSDDGSARAGGDLGWAKRGRYVPEFEAAAFRLEKDEISPVIESEFGFHIIQMLERRGNSIRVRHILIKPDITEADLELARNRLDSVRHLVMDDSMSFSMAVKRFGNEDQQSYNNDGRMVNPATGNTFFEIGDLDPDIYFTVDTMDVGEISAPFMFRDPTGERYFRVVQLQSRSSPHKADLRKDYSKIQMAAIEAKKSEFISDWVSDKVGATYIDIDPMFNGCLVLRKWTVDKTARP